MSQTNLRRGHGRRGPGNLSVVGIGPGDPLDRTARAVRAIRQSTVIVGYSRYLDRIRDLLRGKTRVTSGMRQEVRRCRLALQHARRGATVALISSGDAGIYGMAGLVMELAHEEDFDGPIEVIPGLTAASAAAARLGAPLMLDFACISLSDLLVPWKFIRRRLEAVAAADLVVALYNPRSHRRVRQLAEAAAILRRHRAGRTPVGIATAMGTDDERVVLSDLDHFLDEDIDMRSVVIVGNRSTRRLGPWMVTPRGYHVKTRISNKSDLQQNGAQAPSPVT